MSGRAGRRGLDDRGIVILIIDEKMGPDVGKGLLKVSCFSGDNLANLPVVYLIVYPWDERSLSQLQCSIISSNCARTFIAQNETFF